MALSRRCLRATLAVSSVFNLLCWAALANGRALVLQNPAPGQMAAGTPLRIQLPPLQFMTGYEPAEASAAPPGEVTWMVFQNTSTFPQAFPRAMSVFYESPGSIGDRYARTVADPAGGTNKVLHYWLKNAVIPAGFQDHTKGRIQTGFPAIPSNAVEVYSRRRAYLHPDLNLLTTYPANANSWWIEILLQELWSGANWLGDEFPSRISLTLAPYAGALRLQVRCHSANTPAEYWAEVDLTYAVPVGEWLTIETGYKMGDASTGRFVIVVTTESTGQRGILFNITDWTFDPLALGVGGPGPRLLTHWNPQKLYTSDNVIHFIRDNGGVAQVYWDDFAFGDSWPVASTEKRP